jgi:3-isopropylmalate/(R)-2-methylmalate dehydratase small subunit
METRPAGPQTRPVGPEAPAASPQAPAAGPQAPAAGPQTSAAGLEARAPGPQARAPGPQAFATYTGRGAVLPRSAVAADLLAGWREDPGVVLGRPEFAGATILIACPDPAVVACPDPGPVACPDPGPDSGASPAREHPVGGSAVSERAAPALAARGFQVVISPVFNEILCNNMTTAGVLLLCLPIGKVSELRDIVDADPATVLTVDFGNHEMTAGDRFSAVFEIANSSRWQLPGGLAGGDPAARRGSRAAQPGGPRPAWLPVAGPADLATRIRTAQHRISCLDVPADLRIHLQRRLVAVCDATKAAAADPARCERRLALLAAELDRLAAIHGNADAPDHIPGNTLPGKARAQSGNSLSSRPTRQ